MREPREHPPLPMLKVERMAAGRHVDYLADQGMVQLPRTQRAFTWVMLLLAAETLVGLSAIVFALLLLVNGHPVGWAVYFRSFVVLAMTLTLFYFAWRARQGYYWAYSRLRLFSRIFPVVTLVIAAIPGLYPLWMIIEQIIFSVLLIGVGDFLTSDHMRDTFPSPKRRAQLEAEGRLPKAGRR